MPVMMVADASTIFPELEGRRRKFEVVIRSPWPRPAQLRRPLASRELFGYLPGLGSER